MKVKEIDPPAQQNAAFEFYALNRLEDCSGCYCLTNASGDILYAGQALSIRRRVIQHFDSGKKQTITTVGRISQVWWRTEPVISLNALERGWLELIRLRDGELPPFNRVGGPV